jgi:hypothetical protein
VVTENSETIDNVFLLIYTIEMVPKIIAQGFVMRPFSYLRDGWNVLDFTVVLLGWATLMFEGANNISAIKVIRILRPLRTINQIPKMPSLVATIMKSLPIMFNVMVLELFKEYKKIFSSQIPKQADIGLIQLNSQSARETIQPTPEAYLKEIEKFVPVVIKKNADQCGDWLTQRIFELSKPVSNVDELVDQDGFYNKANLEFQDIRDRIAHVQQTYDVPETYELKVPKEHKESLNEALKQIQDLSGHIETVESTRD